jgi:hypothetical protein
MGHKRIMAKVTVAGRDFEIAPFKIGAMRRAAPFIDRINKRAADFMKDKPIEGEIPKIEGLPDLLCDIIAIVAIGLERIDPAMTAEALEDEIGFSDMAAMRIAYTEILAESGMNQGEAQAPVEAGLPVASKTSSAPSSTHLSRRASKAAQSAG